MTPCSIDLRPFHLYTYNMSDESSRGRNGYAPVSLAVDPVEVR